MSAHRGRSSERDTPVGQLQASAQTDLARNKTPASGSHLLKAELSYAHVFAQTAGRPRELTVGLVGDNLLNETIRNHVSFKKDDALRPELGV